MRRFCFSFIVIALAACGDPAPAEPRAEPRPVPPTDAVAQDDGVRIVFLGDSLTAGFGLSAEAALPEQVEARLRAEGYEIEAVNAGVSADTTANGLARYDWSVAAAEPDLLVVALGANDYLNGGAPETAEANLAQIIERAQTDGVPVALAGLRPRSAGGASPRDSAFADIYPRLAEKYDAPLYPGLLDGVRDAPELLQSDGLHPTAEGVAVMASGLSAFLAAILAKQPPAD